MCSSPYFLFLDFIVDETQHPTLPFFYSFYVKKKSDNSVYL
jgi:hypothetical protein